MKQCSINGIKVNYTPYGDGMFNWHGEHYTIEFMDN